VIDDSAFGHCWNLKSITLCEPLSLTHIGAFTFANSGLLSLSLPSSLETIGEYAFCNTFFLEAVTFNQQSHIQKLGSFAFLFSGIESISFPIELRELGESVFQHRQRMWTFCLDHFTRYIVPLLCFSYISIAIIHIPDSITVLCENAFNCRYFLRTLIFSCDSQLRELSDFDNTAIEEISILDYVKEIGQTAFADCVFLSKVQFGLNSRLQELKSQVFTRSSLQIIVPPRSLKVSHVLHFLIV
jgi:hypothetical protein